MTAALPAAYYAQVEAMADIAEAWMRDHPTRPAVVRWEWPSTIIVSAPLDVVRSLGWVTTNAAGDELLDAMAKPYPREKAPTPLMLRVALDVARRRFQ